MKVENPKDSWFAVIFSVACPGAGQIYAGRFKRGIVFLIFIVFSLVAVMLAFWHPSLRIGAGLLWIAAVYLWFLIFIFVDAYQCANQYNKKHFLKQQFVFRNRFLAILALAVYYLAATAVPETIKNHWMQACRVWRGSMSPTLLHNDLLMADSFIYKYSEPKRGDVVVLKYPYGPREFIKRIVGLPNEILEIKEGRVYINGAALKTPKTFDQTTYFNIGPYAQFGVPVKIPDNTYFVLGDNSQVSHDSRFFGPVSKNNIKARVYKIYYPFHRSGSIYESH